MPSNAWSGGLRIKTGQKKCFLTQRVVYLQNTLIQDASNGECVQKCLEKFMEEKTKIKGY